MAGSGGDVFRGTREQHLVRVVFLLRNCGEQPGNLAPEGAVSEMRGQKRLQALDFWMRNPDYLASELLDAYDAGDGQALGAAKEVLAAGEPERVRLPMTKYLFGAYEPLDDVLAPLVTYGLVTHRAQTNATRVREHTYFLMSAGDAFAEELLAKKPELFTWYEERSKLVAHVAGGDNANKLKARQYQEQEYAGTANEDVIKPITEQVRARLDALDKIEAA